MVKIPQYTPQVNPQFVPTVKQPMDAFTSAAEGGAEVQAKIADITKKFYDLRNSTEKTKALTDTKIELSGIEFEASKDNDTSEANLNKYKQLITEAQNKNLATISDRRVRADATQSLRIDAYNSYSKILTSFRKKDIAKRQYESLRGVAKLHEQYKNEPIESEKVRIKDAAKDIIKEDRATNLKTPKEASAALDDINEWEKDWQDAQLQAVVKFKPYQAEAVLAKMDQIPPEERVAWQASIEAAKKRADTARDKALKKSQDVKAEKGSDLVYKEQMTIGWINDQAKIEVADGGLSKKLLKTMKDQLYKEQKLRVKEIQQTYEGSRDYIELMQTVFKDRRDREDLMRSRELLIEWYGNGKVDPEEAPILDRIMKMGTEIKENENMNPLMWAYKKVRDIKILSEDEVIEKANDLREYIKSLKGNKEEPAVIAERIAQDRYNKNYPDYADWEDNKTYESLIGTTKKLGIDKLSGEPIVEIKQ